MATIYHNDACSKSRESLKILLHYENDPKIVDYLKHPPVASELKALLEKLGLPAARLLRTQEELFRSRYAHTDLSNETAVLRLLSRHPELLERPIVVHKEKAVIGRPPENIHKLFEEN